jgi:archaemetzincin
VTPPPRAVAVEGGAILRRRGRVWLAWAADGTAGSPVSASERADRVPHREEIFPDLELRLAHLAEPLGRPAPGDWLAQHREKGQTFRQYLSADPVRRGGGLGAIYLCLVGAFDQHQQRIIDLTREYLGAFFDVPVVVRRRVPLSDVPSWARRTHPEWGVKQVLTGFLLSEVLGRDVPDDALAYLALTARDLWPGDGWNFVFGEADLRRRVGVWSIHRNGWPGKGGEAFRQCLRRTLMTASHETGHVLTMRHCTAHRCLMNGCNSLEEGDRTPLHPCPVCLRKLCWNLQVEPAAHLRRLAGFCQTHGLEEDGIWFATAAEAVGGG